MFVGWRDLRFARGRFALMGGVIVLITTLVGLLSGLTAGLGRENVSAVTGLRADHVAFGPAAGGQDISFSDSTVTQRQQRVWAEADGVTSAEPLGTATTRAAAGDHSAAVSLFGSRPGAQLAPDSSRLGEGRAVLSEGAADDLAVTTGDRITVSGRTLTVAAVRGDASFSHTPVVWTGLEDWRRLAAPGAAAPGGSPAKGAAATVIALRTTGAADLSAVDARAGTETVSREDALSAIGSYSSENGSLQLMRGFLFAISALVIGAFFTVWTIQRSTDIAVLKALGASTRYLLRDALGQALVLLVLGTVAGTGAAALLGAAVPDEVPFVLDTGTVLLPAAVMVLLGAAGAALAVRRITSVDPLTALGSAR